MNKVTELKIGQQELKFNDAKIKEQYTRLVGIILNFNLED